jgi:hypothetical protein
VNALAANPVPVNAVVGRRLLEHSRVSQRIAAAPADDAEQRMNSWRPGKKPPR